MPSSSPPLPPTSDSSEPAAMPANLSKLRHKRKGALISITDVDEAQETQFIEKFGCSEANPAGTRVSFVRPKSKNNFVINSESKFTAPSPLATTATLPESPSITPPQPSLPAPSLDEVTEPTPPQPAMPAPSLDEIAPPAAANNKEEITYNEDGSIKFASMEVLVKKMVSEKGGDASFMNHFLLTMNLHTTPDAFLDALTRHFREDSGMATKLRVFVVLMTWVEKLWNASTDPQLVARVREFAATSNMEKPSKKLEKLINKKLAVDADPAANTQQKDYIFSEEVPPPIMPVSYLLGVRTPPAEVTLENADIREVARQLALGEIELFKAIKPWEFQNLNFARKDKTLAPNVHAYSRHFNAVSKWAAWRVLERKDLGERTRALEKLIELAEWSSKAQNYNAVNEIISACTSSAVYRLHKTWDAISPRHTAVFKELSELMAPAKSYAAFRNKLHTLHPPCVPYIGVYQTDLTFIEEGNPTMCDGLVNWKKCRLQASIIVEIQTYQQAPYGFLPVPWIKDFFLGLEPRNDDNEMWNASITIEPKERKASETQQQQQQLLSSSSSQQQQPIPTPTQSPAPSASPLYQQGTIESSDETGVPTSAVPGEGNISGDSAADGYNEEEEDEGNVVVIKVLLPGSSVFYEAATPRNRSALRIKEQMVRGGAERGMLGWDDVEEQRWRSMHLVGFSKDMPLGVEVSDDSGIDLSIMTFFALYRNKQMVRIACPHGFGMDLLEGHITADYEAPLFSLVKVLMTIQQPITPASTANSSLSLSSSSSLTAGPSCANDSGHSTGSSGDSSLTGSNNDPTTTTGSGSAGDAEESEFLLMRVRVDKESDRRALAWVNCNVTLKEQGFMLEDNTDNPNVMDTLVVLPKNRCLLRPDTEEAARSRKNRMPKGAKFAYMGRCSARSLTRCGCLTKQMLTGTAPTFRKGTFATERDKCWLLAIDNLLFCYKDCTSLAPTNVWGLDFCTISIGVAHNTQMCITIRPIPDTPFAAAAAAAASTAALSGSSQLSATNPGGLAGSSVNASPLSTSGDLVGSSSSLTPIGSVGGNSSGSNSSISSIAAAATVGGSGIGSAQSYYDRSRAILFLPYAESSARTWSADLAQRSRACYKTRVFGEQLDTLCRRDAAPAPRFLTEAIDQLVTKATRVENLLSAQPPVALFERYRDAINVGVCPIASDPTELACLAQCVLMLFTELPEPLFPFSMYPSIAAYCKENKTPNIEALRSLVCELSYVAANSLFCLLLFFKLWADENNTLRKAAITVAQVVAYPSEFEPAELQSSSAVIETAARFGEDLLNNFPKFDMLRLGPQVAVASANSSKTYDTRTTLVTVLPQSEIDDIIAFAVDGAANKFSKYEPISTPDVPKAVQPSSDKETEFQGTHRIKSNSSKLSQSICLSIYFY